MTVTNFPKLSGVNEEFVARPNVTNNPNITGVGDGVLPPPILIDAVGEESEGAYSFKQLASAYVGPIVKVRRTSDSLEQDFTASEVVSSLSTFLASTTGFVTTWYDQSGNARHLVQATTADQPQVLVDSDGFFYVNTINGDFLRAATFAGATTNMTMHVLWSAVSNGTAPIQSSFQGGIDFAAGNGDIVMPWWTGAMSPTYKGNTNTDFDWIDSKLRQHTFKFLNNACRIFEFGSSGRDANAQTNPTYARLTVGKVDAQNANARFYELVFFALDIDATLLASITKANYASFFTVDKFRMNIGDSNTSAGFVLASQQWSRKVYDNISATEPWIGRAIGAFRLADIIANPERITQSINQFDSDSYTFNLFLGTNDIVTDAQTGAQVLTKYETVCDIIRAAVTAKGGACRINAFTMLPRTATGFAAQRTVFNAGILANANGKWDAIVDTTSNPNLEDQNNATYFVDTTHLSNTGQTELANLVGPIMTQEDVIAAQAILFSQTGNFIDNVAFVNGQTFTSLFDCELTNIQMWLQRLGTPTGNVKLNLHVADDNTPALDGITATIIATSSTSIDMSTIDNAAVELCTFDFTGVTLVAGTKYAIAYDPTVVTSVSGANAILSRRTANPAGVNQYAGGNYSTVGATSGFDLDYNFVVNGVRDL